MRVLAVPLVQLAMVVDILVQHPLILAHEELKRRRSFGFEDIQFRRMRRHDK